MVPGPLFALACLCTGVFLYTNSCDPSESTFSVQLRNDTGSGVVLRQCDVRCNEFHEIDRLEPNQSVPVNTTENHVDNWWVIEDTSGHRLGCLDLLFDHKQVGVVINISQHVNCPAS